MASRTVLEKTLVVHEICPTIQGESTSVGRLCILVRLAGCTHSCRYCDTPQARPFDAGRAMTIAEILETIAPLQCRLILITGGEPLAQPASADLARALIERDFEVLVETAGSFPIDVLPDEVIKIMDVKCPGSGESESMDWTNIEHLSPNDEVKFVVSDRADYDWARAVIGERRLAERCTVLLSPAFGRVEPKQLADWIVADRLPVRLQIQLHKYVWGPDAKGV